MSQSAVMDLSGRVYNDLRELQRQHPTIYHNVRASLRGWKEELEEYWVEVTRGPQRWRLTTVEEWQHIRKTIEATPERLVDAPPPATPAPRPATPPNPRPTTKPAVSTVSTRKAAPRVKAKRDEDEDFSWLPRALPTRRAAKAIQRAAKETRRTPLPAKHSRNRDAVWGVKAASTPARPLQPDAVAWRQQQRPAVLSQLQKKITAWIGGQAWQLQQTWRLAHVSRPRPPEHRPAWAGDADTYVLLTHVPSGRHWELDLLEDWRRIEQEVTSLNRGTSIATSPAPPPALAYTAVPPTRTPASLPRCPHCAVPVKVTNMERHVKRCPQRMWREASQPAARPATSAGGSVPRLAPPLASRRGPSSGAQWTAGAGAAPEDIGFADPRDASKGWGHRFRDHGRYGSYPVHDGYGEEADS